MVVIGWLRYMPVVSMRPDVWGVAVRWGAYAFVRADCVAARAVFGRARTPRWGVVVAARAVFVRDWRDTTRRGSAIWVVRTTISIGFVF